MNTITELISNTLPDLAEMPQFAAILGESPSKGARSPLLWNAAFKALDIECEMLPMDVSRENLTPLLEALDQDSRFIGAAVAVPHKEAIARWLATQSGERLSPEALAIGAVNALYRNSEGVLCATNTDGEGALRSLTEKYSELAGANVLLIGPGGAGKAVAAFVRRALGRNGQLLISARQPEQIRDFADKLDAFVTPWPPSQDILSKVDIVINCTVIGSKSTVSLASQTLNLLDYTPLTALDESNSTKSTELLKELPATGLVFDIIYDPSPSKLLTLAADVGLETLDGLMMNLEQAVLAFQYATGETENSVRIREEMAKV